MAPKSFSLALRDDGTARLSFIYRKPGEPGISRLSCDLSRPGLSRLIAFAEICDLHSGRRPRFGLELEALSLRCLPDGVQVLRLGRTAPAGAAIAFAELREELGEATDRCLALARQSGRGGMIWDLLQDCCSPGMLPRGGGGDAADHLLHRLAEITLLSLAGEAANPRSGLSRKLRRRKGSAEALDHVRAALAAQARLLHHGAVPAPAIPAAISG
ncbi:hypothetical protein [Mangrovicoccus algicola]|uniref:Uncharacterized protein n=1 Tax=Mangrovicoccus algicola TaxID=2771008 RepID=A0A8J6YTI8_9RHOB|nr:hypothetical protein [Mangrovicoccus algicola]MBE3637237.1 hypothetical protein [Mangrovicoccus algicola]